MRRVIPCVAVTGLAVLLALPGAAQPVNSIAVPPAPPLVASPPTSLPPPPPASANPAPGLVQTPLPPANQDSGAAASATAAPDDALPPQLDSSWLPGKTAAIGVLNKVDGSISNINVPVGGQTTIGDLSVNVLACVLRPPDQIPDAAIFISAASTAAGTDGPIYRGWMVRSTPGAAVVGDASETFRVIGCS